jgi:hypothetical protein
MFQPMENGIRKMEMGISPELSPHFRKDAGDGGSPPAVNLPHRRSLASPALVILGFLLIIFGTFKLLAAATKETLPVIGGVAALAAIGTAVTLWCGFASAGRADDEADDLLAALTRNEEERKGPGARDERGWESP